MQIAGGRKKGAQNAPFIDKVKIRHPFRDFPQCIYPIKDRFDGKHIIICCGSWLLYPDNLNILPEKSNTCDFILDFEPLDIKRTYDFGDCWRIFGQNKSCLKPEELQRDTTMQKAFAEWFDQGKKAGSAYSMIVFDGENILTRMTREEMKEKYGY